MYTYSIASKANLTKDPELLCSTEHLQCVHGIMCSGSWDCSTIIKHVARNCNVRRNFLLLSQPPFQLIYIYISFKHRQNVYVTENNYPENKQPQLRSPLHGAIITLLQPRFYCFVSNYVSRYCTYFIFLIIFIISTYLVLNFHHKVTK